MMKNTRMLKLSTLALILFCVGMSSCSNDDNEAINQSDLIDTWKLEKIQLLEKTNGKITDSEELYKGDYDFDDYFLYIRFDSNKETFEGDNPHKMESCGTWEIRGNKLIRTEEEGSIITTIKKLNSTDLVTEDYHFEKDGNTLYEYYETVTYKKIK